MAIEITTTDTSMRPLDTANLAECFALSISYEQREVSQIPEMPELLEKMCKAEGVEQRVFFFDDMMIGYASYAKKEALNAYEILYFLIDERWQGRKYGTKSFRQLLNELTANEDCGHIKIRYMDFNEAARALYAKFGFVEIGESDGYVDAVLICQPEEKPKTQWCLPLNAWVTVLEERMRFGRALAKVSVEGTSVIHTISRESLSDRRDFDLPTALAIVAGARIWEALGSDLFLAPLVSRVLPLPHQFRALRHAMSEFPVRRMLAEEVGLGKTIEAGLILKELKLRGLVQRVLILTPKSLLLQWVVEMENLFDERFDLVLPGDWGADVGLRGENAWKRYTQVITSFDSVKPRDSQKGWTADRLARLQRRTLSRSDRRGFRSSNRG